MFKFDLLNGVTFPSYTCQADEGGILEGAEAGGGGNGEGSDSDSGTGSGAVDDSGSGGDDSDGGGDAGDGGDTSERPEYIAEQFWDAEKGEVRLESLGKSFNDTKADYDRLKAEKQSDVPEKAEDYLTGDYVQAGEGDDDPGTFKIDGEVKNLDPIKLDDPALLHFAEAAQKRGISPEQFAGIVGDMTVFADGMMPAPLDVKAELESLGKEGPRLAGTLKSWADSMLSQPGENQLSEAEYNYLMAFGAPAIGIRVMNKMRASMGGKNIPVDLDTGGNALPSQDEWYASRPDGRTDPDAYAEWQEQGAKLFGTGTTGGDIGRGLGQPSSRGAARPQAEDPGGRQTRKRV